MPAADRQALREAMFAQRELQELARRASLDYIIRAPQRINSR